MKNETYISTRNILRDHTKPEIEGTVTRPDAETISGLRDMGMRRKDAEFITAILSHIDFAEDKDKALDRIKSMIVDRCAHPRGLYKPFKRTRI